MTGIAYHQAAAGSEERGNDGRCERSLARQCNGHQMISNQRWDLIFRQFVYTVRSGGIYFLRLILPRDCCALHRLEI